MRGGGYPLSLLWRGRKVHYGVLIRTHKTEKIPFTQFPEDCVQGLMMTIFFCFTSLPSEILPKGHCQSDRTYNGESISH